MDALRLLLLNSPASSSVQDLCERALSNCDYEVLKLLVDAGCITYEEADNKIETPLHWNAYCGIKDLVHFKEGGMDNADKTGKTPLHVAVLKGDKESAQLLLKYGADKEKRVWQDHDKNSEKNDDIDDDIDDEFDDDDLNGHGMGEDLDEEDFEGEDEDDGEDDYYKKVKSMKKVKRDRISQGKQEAKECRSIPDSLNGVVDLETILLRNVNWDAVLAHIAPLVERKAPSSSDAPGRS